MSRIRRMTVWKATCVSCDASTLVRAEVCPLTDPDLPHNFAWTAPDGKTWRCKMGRTETGYGRATYCEACHNADEMHLANLMCGLVPPRDPVRYKEVMEMPMTPQLPRPQWSDFILPPEWNIE